MSAFIGEKRLKPGITVGMPVFHEAENLKWILPVLKKALDETGQEYTILIIDTKEPTDNTPDICRAEGVSYIPQEYPGYAGAIRTAAEYADRECLLTLDADGSHDPKYIPLMYDRYVENGCDLVVGSRYIPGGETDDIWYCILMSKVLNMIFRRIIGTDVKDISAGYKIYNTEKLKSVEITSTNFEIHQEVLLKLLMTYPDLKVSEYPIRFVKRKYDKSKRRMVSFATSFLKSIVKLTKMRRLG